MELTGKTAVVTGGAVRLGRAIAVGLASEGVHVVLHYGRSAVAAEETLAEIERLGGRAVTVPADLLAPEAAAKTVFDAAVAEFGGVDFLINSAAIFEPARLVETTEALFDRHFAINLKSPLFLCREFVRQLEPQQHGHIVNIADWRATRPDPAYLAYTLTKSGLIALTQALAKDLGPRVQVNAVAPGAILPPPEANEAEFRALGENNLLGRVGGPQDITSAVLFLLGSDFITGHLLYIDGGENLAR